MAPCFQDAMPVKRFRSRDFAGNPRTLRPKSVYKKKTAYRAKPKRRSFASRVKSVMLKTCESKDLNWTHEKQELNHNIFYAKGLNIVAAQHPALGTGDSERIGDKIYVGGYMLRMLIGQKADRPNVTFRWALLEVPRGATYTYNNWVENHSGNILLDPFNKDYVRVLKSGTWRPNQAALATSGDREYTFAKKIWVPYRKQYVYGPEDGARTLSLSKDLYFIIGPYDAYGTLGSDNIAYIQMVQTLYYKDP